MSAELDGQADIDDGRRPGLTSEVRAELVKLRRDKRVLEMEIEILKRAGAYFGLYAMNAGGVE